MYLYYRLGPGTVIITTQDCLLGFDLEKCQIVQQNLNYLPPSPASLRIARNCLIMFSVAKGLSSLNSDSR